MTKGIVDSMRLSKGSACHDAFIAKVDSLWEQHGNNIEAYPAPKVVIDEFKDLLIPYGRNRNNKGRNLYKRLLKQKFEEDGQFFECFLIYFPYIRFLIILFSFDIR